MALAEQKVIVVNKNGDAEVRHVPVTPEQQAQAEREMAFILDQVARQAGLRGFNLKEQPK